MSKDKRGFTLIELLVVMGILGILMAVTILVINPAQYLARARDTQRINDLQAINSAVSIALANGKPMTAVTGACYASVAVTFPVACGGSTTAQTGDRSTGGTSGWVRGIDTSESMGTLPIDPTNSGNYYYIWYNNGTSYEIDANSMESTYYTSGSNSVGANDGGSSNASCAPNAAGTCRYEVGSLLTLIP